MVAIFAALLVAASLFCVAAYYSFAYGYVASCIWAWFMVPMGLPVLSWKACAAVLMLVNMMKSSESRPSEKQDGSDIVGKIIGHGIAPWFVLLVAWFIHN